MKKISIIIRTKNEERWINHCLSMIQKQKYSNYEVILVDNMSSDNTIKIAQRYDFVKVIKIKNFLPGLAINDGIKESTGEYIIILSAHCVPVNKSWITNLLKNFEDESIAGVYGRQFPVSFTDPIDKRDLLITFGEDRRIQIKDYFFHNANSMIKKSVWETYPFDEEVTNIEDRVWGKKVIDSGFKLIYEPQAPVYHYHGLHHGNKAERAKGVVSIIEKVDASIINNIPESLKPENVNIAAVIPLAADISKDDLEFELLQRCTSELKSCKYINNIFLLSNQEFLAKKLNVIHIDRNNNLIVPNISIEEVLQYSLERIESMGIFPENIVYVNSEYSSRPKNLFKNLINEMQFKGHDTVFPSFAEYNSIWYKDEQNKYAQIDDSLKSRQTRDPIFRSLYGLGTVSAASIIRKGKLIGENVGIISIDNFKHTLRIKETGSREIIENLIIKKE